MLRAASLAGVPAIELRAISNEIGEPDRARWQIAEAIAALSAVTPGAARGDRRRRRWAAQSSRIRTATSSCSFALPL